MELGNAFSELNDPAEQERRFRLQVERAAKRCRARWNMDYVRALAHGMPPTAGRNRHRRLTMLFTDSHSIREVILFPLLRPEASASRRPRKRRIHRASFRQFHRTSAEKGSGAQK